MDDFQQDFIRKVKNPTLEGEVVGSSGAPKKPIDKRWFIIIGLILILIITLIVLLIISNTNSTSGSDTNNSGDPIKTEDTSNATWSCSDGSSITFDGNANVVWTDEVAIIRDTYVVNNNQITFGNTTGTISGDTLTLEFNNTKITCERSAS